MYTLSEALMKSSLSSSSKLIYAVLLNYYDKNLRMSQISQPKIAELINITRSTVRNCLEELEKEGLVSIQKLEKNQLGYLIVPGK